MIILSFDLELAKLVTLAGNGELLTKGMFQRADIACWDTGNKAYPILGTVKELHCGARRTLHWNNEGKALESLSLKVPRDDYYDLFIYSSEEDV